MESLIYSPDVVGSNLNGRNFFAGVFSLSLWKIFHANMFHMANFLHNFVKNLNGQLHKMFPSQLCLDYADFTKS